MTIPRQWLGEHIGYQVLSVHVDRLDRSICDMLSNEVILNIDVLSPGMVTWILGESNAALTVGVNSSWFGHAESKLSQEHSPPDRLFSGLSGRHVFSLH